MHQSQQPSRSREPDEGVAALGQGYPVLAEVRAFSQGLERTVPD